MVRVTLILVLLALVPTVTHAQDEEETELYAAFYGDGIRAYTESRYDDALEHLYRAFALKQTHFALKLIVRSHDFQGNCSARERAATMYAELFGADGVPMPQRCVDTGELEVACLVSSGEVLVDREFRAECGAVVRVPTGEHRVESLQTGEARVLEVRSGERAVAEVGLHTRRFYLSDDPRSEREHRQGDSGDWPRLHLLVDPDMPREFETDVLDVPRFH